jgi:hypothetical protein
MLKIFEYLAICSAVAFAICLIVLMFFYGSPSATPQPPQQQHAEENKAVKNQGEAEKPFWEKATTDPVAAFTLFLVIFTAVLCAVGVIQLNMLTRAETVAEKTAQAAKDSAEVASKTLIATQRPWIYPEVGVGSDLVLDDEGAKVTFAYILRNSGNTPATNVDVQVKFFAFQLGKDTGTTPNFTVVIPQTDPAAELIKFCNDLTATSEGMAKANWLSGFPIFQGRELGDRVAVTIAKAEIDAAREQSAYKSLIPILLFCVTYRFPFDTKSHHTGLIFQLFRSDQENAGRPRELRPDDRFVPQGHLQLLPHPFRSGVAN